MTNIITWFTCAWQRFSQQRKESKAQTLLLKRLVTELDDAYLVSVFWESVCSFRDPDAYYKSLYDFVDQASSINPRNKEWFLYTRGKPWAQK